MPYVREDQEARAAEAERQLVRLGKVNPLALEEYAALQERHQFLATQLEDLRKTRRDLLMVVKEVDDRVQEVFASAYADTAREFEGLFARLFPGGSGRLILTEPDDMLTTGIEIEARPPGKKVKRLSLLSGGERSLTAIAYLFAIFKARPSPFYVLDEVEAALDDTNLQRLLRVFDELQESSQLIVITHQRRTMEAADALYGVSMRGDGVSQVISQRVRETELGLTRRDREARAVKHAECKAGHVVACSRGVERGRTVRGRVGDMPFWETVGLYDCVHHPHRGRRRAAARRRRHDAAAAAGHARGPPRPGSRARPDRLHAQARRHVRGDRHGDRHRAAAAAAPGAAGAGRAAAPRPGEAAALGGPDDPAPGAARPVAERLRQRAARPCCRGTGSTTRPGTSSKRC